MTLSSNLEDYLEVIVGLSKKSGHAHSADIAAELKVKKPSVTSALRRLAEKGFIVYKPYAPVELTIKGQRIAEKIQSKHDVVKRFLIEFLEVESDKANKVACEIEHTIDGEINNKLEKFMDLMGNSDTFEQYKTVTKKNCGNY